MESARHVKRAVKPRGFIVINLLSPKKQTYCHRKIHLNKSRKCITMESDDSKTLASLGQALSTIRPTLLKKQIIGALETEANEQQAKRWSPSLRREVGSATTFLL